MRPKLVAVDGPERGKSHPLDRDVFTVGRQESNDLQILAAAVSRRHCVIELRDGRWQVHDAGSAHGTFVNGEPVERRDLLHGDFLQVGTVAFVFLHDSVLSIEGGAPFAGALATGTTQVGLPKALGEDLDEDLSPDLGAALERSARRSHGLVGEGRAMTRLRDFIDRVAGVDSTVLLRGESGTGKELVARALHRASRRADGPFIELNCATLSETLLESELFGHERGAFTGAVARKIGRFEAAHGGTLFLDEVGEIAVNLQARLLRALQERRFERVGGAKPIEVDVRLIAATNRDLEQAIRGGEFREDLFYRLNVIHCTLPPVRERREDVPLLARHFVRHHGVRLHRLNVGIDPAVRRALVAYDWPGNVREISNVIERALVLGDGEMIRPEDLPDEMLAAGGDGQPFGDYQSTIHETKKRLLATALAEAGGNAAEAARRLGLHPNSFRRLWRRLGSDDTGGGDDEGGGSQST